MRVRHAASVRLNGKVFISMGTKRMEVKHYLLSDGAWKTQLAGISLMWEREEKVQKKISKQGQIFHPTSK